jgi:hypothetical protein
MATPSKQHERIQHGGTEITEEEEAERMRGRV